MFPGRKQIYQAFAAHLAVRLVAQPAPAAPPAFPFVTVEAKVRDWANVAPGEMPYLGISLYQEAYLPVDRTQTARAGGLYGNLARWRLMPRGWIYVRTGDDRGTAQDVLADALDAIEAALFPAPGFEVETLGDLVFTARIHDIQDTDEGSLGQTAVAKILFELLADQGLG